MANYSNVCRGPIDMLNLANPDVLRVQFRKNKAPKARASIGHILRQNGEFEAPLLIHIDAPIFLPTSLFEDQKQSIGFNIMRQGVETKIGILAIINKFLQFTKGFVEKKNEMLVVTPSTVFVSSDDVQIYGRLVTNSDDAFANRLLEEEKNNTSLVMLSSDLKIINVASPVDPMKIINVSELIAAQGRALQVSMILAPVIFVSVVTGVTHIKLHFDPKYICIIKSICSQIADVNDYFSSHLLSTAGRKLLEEKDKDDQLESMKNLQN